MDGTGACGEQLEVGVSGLGEGGKGGRQRAGSSARLVLEQGLLVRRMLDVFADAPGAGVQRDSLTLPTGRSRTKAIPSSRDRAGGHPVVPFRLLPTSSADVRSWHGGRSLSQARAGYVGLWGLRLAATRRRSATDF